MSWKIQSKQKHIFEQEVFLEKINFDKPFRFAFVYPNTYDVGMSNLGLHILYNLLNTLPRVSCERFFLPNKKELELHKSTSSPLYSIETQRKLSDFQVIAVTMSFEGDYFNLLTILELGGIPLTSTNRTNQHPLVIIGGPCATFNPAVLSIFADAFVIGEGEETLVKIAKTLEMNSNLSREAQIQLLAAIPGVYVPQCDNTATRQWVNNIEEYPAHSIILTTQTEFNNMFIIETSRGCSRGCRFCMAGYAFRYPRHRSFDSIINILKKYYSSIKKVGLMGPAVSDYPNINKLAESILDMGMDFSVASLRVDSLTEKLAKHLASSGQKTLTIAPEAGSQRLRDIINKGISEDNIMKAVELLSEVHIPNLKLYFMIGLPFENQEDIQAIITLVGNLRHKMDETSTKGKLILSINTFVPKPFTPFQWLPLDNKVSIENKITQIRNAFKSSKNIKINFESYKETVQQALLAKGDKTIGEMILLAHQNGGSSQFLKTLKEQNIDISKYIYEETHFSATLPWDNINLGFTKNYLQKEFEKSAKEQVSPPCFSGCRLCGVCSDTSNLSNMRSNDEQ